MFKLYNLYTIVYSSLLHVFYFPNFKFLTVKVKYLKKGLCFTSSKLTLPYRQLVPKQNKNLIKIHLGTDFFYINLHFYKAYNITMYH
jgi:hypothetical protein